MKVYCIKDKSGQFLSSTGWADFPYCRFYETKEKADIAFKRLVLNSIGLFRSTRPLSEIKEWHVEQVEIESSFLQKYDTDGVVEGALIRKEIQNHSYVFANFWEHLVRCGASEDIEYLLQVRGPLYKPSMEELKEIRNTIRLLGVKTNQYRSQGYFFAFNSAEKAMNARLCLDIEHFLDITEMRVRVAKLLSKA